MRKALIGKQFSAVQGQGLIHTAAREGQHEAIELLIEWQVPGLDTRYLVLFLQQKPIIGFPYIPHDPRDSRGRTPLWLAVSGQHAATCSLLIGAGADPRVVDNQGVSVEELARKPDVKDIVASALAQNA